MQFNFSANVVNWFNVIYHQASSCALHNGHASNVFLLERDVRQGCPLSGLLFIIGLKLFASAVQKDHNINRRSIEEREIKIAQCADDTTVFVRDQILVSYLVKLTDEFKEVSGIQINASKTESLWLGVWRDCMDDHFGFN